MKRYLVLGLALVGFAVNGVCQTSLIYQNFGTVSQLPQIDATTFVNGGIFGISSSGGIIISSGAIISYGDPFDTQNTVYYTNLASGLMSYQAGFNIYFLTNNFPYPAGAFVNRGEMDGYLLKIAATNITSSGIISADGGGLLKMDGQRIDITRGGLDASAVGGINANAGTTLYVGVGTNTSLGAFNGRGRGIPLSTFDLPSPASPTHQVLFNAGGSYATNNVMVPVLSTSGFAAFANTNQIDPSNTLVQVIFVSTNSFDTNLVVRAGFLAPPQGYQADAPGNFAVVEWSYPDFDIVRGNPFTNFFYLVDTAATQTNFAYFTNQANGTYLSPDNFTLCQATNQTFYLGLNNPVGSTITSVSATKLLANTTYTNTLIADPNYAATKTVTNFYASYSAAVGPSAASAVVTSGGYNPALSDPTNLPGRVELTGQQVDLTRARVRADSLFSITASNFISATNMIMDAALLSFDLGTTNSSFIVSNMIPVRVKRLNGTISAWTGLWTNSLDVANTNATPPTTNTISIITHVLIVDHSFTGQQIVQSYKMALHATNVVINDDLYLTKIFDIDAVNFANNANLYGTALDYFDLSNYPRLNNFTNSGSISVASGDMSAVLPQSNSSFVNSGLISASGAKFAANTFINSGVINSGASAGLIGPSAGGIIISAATAKLDDGQLLAAGDVRLSGNNFKVRNAKISGSTLYLNITNMLSDSVVTNNTNGIWLFTSGFQMQSKPATGDLLNTTLISSNAIFAQTMHVWAGQDRGPNPSGYTNNAAIGKLILKGATSSQFAFTGAGVSNALYIDYLDLENNATNYLDSLFIDTNMVVYFAAANLPAEQLNGQFNGHLRWVSSYTGPNSSTNITLPNGQKITINLALYKSKTIDSNGNGIPNASDPNPFTFKLTKFAVTNTPTQLSMITWTAAAQTLYRIEYATNLFQPAWQLLTSYTNPGATNRVVTITNSIPAISGQVYFRVGYTP